MSEVITVKAITIESDALSTNTVNVNLGSDALSGWLHVESTGNITFTSTSYTANRERSVVITNTSASPRALTFPAAWKFLGGKPGGIAAGKAAVLSLRSTGTTEGAVVAAWAQQDALPEGETLLHTGDKQSSLTDATADKLLTVGSFGLGAVGSAPENNDLDSITTSGLYKFETPTSGTPGFNFGTLLVLKKSAPEVIQIASAITSDTVKQRRRISGAWTAWRTVYNQGSILGTVSQSAGVPTGAIIERGSNANGEYVRFADGTQICLRYNGITFARHGTDARTMLAAWTFPAAFSTTPRSLPLLDNEAAKWSPSTLRNIISLAGEFYSGSSTSEAQLRLILTTDAGASDEATGQGAYAIGRWF